MPPATASRSIMPMVARRSRSFMALHVVARAEEAVLLGAEGDEDDGVRRVLRLDARRGLQQQSDAGGVVGVALADGRRVVVGADDQALGRLPLLDGDDVGGVDAPPRRARDELLSAREVAVLLKRVEDELARLDLAPGVGGARVHGRGERLGQHVGHRPVGGGRHRGGRAARLRRQPGRSRRRRRPPPGRRRRRARPPPRPRAGLHVCAAPSSRAAPGPAGPRRRRRRARTPSPPSTSPT